MDISVTVSRLPAPGMTVLGGVASYAPGGKGANQAVAAARLGAQVRMVGCVGEDDFGGRLRDALREEGIDDTGVRAVPGAPTGLAMITVDESGENMITVAPGANREVGKPEIAAIAATARPAVRRHPGDASEGLPGIRDTAGPGRPSGTPASCRALVVSAEIPEAAIGAALAAGGAGPRILNLAPAPPSSRQLLAVTGTDWLVVNEPEAAAVLGRRVSGLAGAASAAAELAALGSCHAVVTAGAAGAAYCARGSGNAVAVPGFRVRAVDTVGAGDTFVGALAVAIAAGVSPAEAVRAACAAGAAATTRPGTQPGMPRPREILAATGLTWPAPGSSAR